MNGSEGTANSGWEKKSIYMFLQNNFKGSFKQPYSISNQIEHSTFKQPLSCYLSPHYSLMFFVNIWLVYLGSFYLDYGIHRGLADVDHIQRQVLLVVGTGQCNLSLGVIYEGMDGLSFFTVGIKFTWKQMKEHLLQSDLYICMK